VKSHFVIAVVLFCGSSLCADAEDLPFCLATAGARAVGIPADAPRDAERDIRTHTIAFRMIGGCAATFPGVPATCGDLLLRFPALYAGSPGCLASTTYEQYEYARRYNEYILNHLVLHPDA